MRIREVSLTNFRSLQDVHITGLRPAVVFHGENNSGKSNILLALRAIFSSKLAGGDVRVAPDASDQELIARQSPFWQGMLENFSDNYYMGSLDPIKFSIRLLVSPSFFAGIEQRSLLEKLAERDHDYRVFLEGRIERVGDQGQMHLDRFDLNGKQALQRKGDQINWFPHWTKEPEESKQQLGEAVLDKFTDQVGIVPASRFLSDETYLQEERELKAQQFKNWLFSTSLSKERFVVYKKICQWFAGAPFHCGEVSFLRHGDDLEVMVGDGSGYRMPIEFKGSGIQQILVLLAYVANTDAAVVCIEEPELNLSFGNQDSVVNIVRGLIESGGSPYQVLLTSHSDHIGSRNDLARLHVEKTEIDGTCVRGFTAADRAALFPRSKGRRRMTLGIGSS